MDKQAFSGAMDAYLQDLKDLSAKLHEQAGGMAGTVREQADAAIADIGRGRDALAERLPHARTASGGRWRESKVSIAAARAELERKVDDAMKKFE